MRSWLQESSMATLRAGQSGPQTSHPQRSAGSVLHHQPTTMSNSPDLLILTRESHFMRESVASFGFFPALPLVDASVAELLTDGNVHAILSICLPLATGTSFQ